MRYTRRTALGIRIFSATGGTSPCSCDGDVMEILRRCPVSTMLACLVATAWAAAVYLHAPCQSHTYATIRAYDMYSNVPSERRLYEETLLQSFGEAMPRVLDQVSHHARPACHSCMSSKQTMIWAAGKHHRRSGETKLHARTARFRCSIQNKTVYTLLRARAQLMRRMRFGVAALEAGAVPFRPTEL